VRTAFVTTKKRPHEPRAVGDLVAGALKDLGVPSARLTKRVHDAWALAADPAWRGQTEPLALVGGVLQVGVRSSSLRHELASFHRARLLSVLKAALPDVTLVGLRFTSEIPAPDDRPAPDLGLATYGDPQ
jgi:hypothetical protein